MQSYKDYLIRDKPENCLFTKPNHCFYCFMLIYNRNRMTAYEKEKHLVTIRGGYCNYPFIDMVVCRNDIGRSDKSGNRSDGD